MKKITAPEDMTVKGNKWIFKRFLIVIVLPLLNTSVSISLCYDSELKCAF
ncbi:hypothetical protein GXY_10780 [Novacetimonas hansenii ATCC 23769]|uniref:Uncharacterized protein n=1 Tax=Novacetimonas hansenii ATCC 23769 TaxID=714995 RepID=D5QG85_NOVHA|nr:hypothetical protein GXY_10780 [Novacetimonas hansenii ATCC 23769]